MLINNVNPSISTEKAVLKPDTSSVLSATGTGFLEAIKQQGVALFSPVGGSKTKQDNDFMKENFKKNSTKDKHETVYDFIGKVEAAERRRGGQG